MTVELEILISRITIQPTFHLVHVRLTSSAHYKYVCVCVCNDYRDSIHADNMWKRMQVTFRETRALQHFTLKGEKVLWNPNQTYSRLNLWLTV